MDVTIICDVETEFLIPLESQLVGADRLKQDLSATYLAELLQATFSLFNLLDPSFGVVISALDLVLERCQPRVFLDDPAPFRDFLLLLLLLWLLQILRNLSVLHDGLFFFFSGRQFNH